MTHAERDATWRAWWADGAWAQLAPAIRRLARTVARQGGADADTADDIAAVLVARCWALSVAPTTPGAYVASAARHATTDHHKRRDTRDRRATTGLDMDSLTAPDVTTDHAPPEAVAWMRRAVRALPDDLRRPLVLYTWRHRDCATIARTLGTTRDAVKMRLVRARRRLAAAYHDTSHRLAA